MPAAVTLVDAQFVALQTMGRHTACGPVYPVLLAQGQRPFITTVLTVEYHLEHRLSTDLEEFIPALSHETSSP